MSFSHYVLYMLTYYSINIIIAHKILFLVTCQTIYQYSGIQNILRLLYALFITLIYNIRT